VDVNKFRQGVELTKNAHGCLSQIRLPIKFIWIIVDMVAICSGNPFAQDCNKAAAVECTSFKGFDPRNS